MNDKPLLMLLAFAAALTGCGTPGDGQTGPVDLPEDNGIYAVTWYIDPVDGNDANDGLSEDFPFRSLDPFSAAGIDGKNIYPAPGSKIAIKRGTVLRLTETFNLKGGTEAGWVAWGAWGPESEPKPVIAGSVELLTAAWTSSESGIYETDWSAQIDTTGNRSADGMEQGPGNLWFFDAAADDAAMTLWGWRQPSDITSGSSHGDWYYDADGQKLRLRWDSPPPAVTEAGVNRFMMDFSGQDFLLVEDLDFRYGGNYVLRGSMAGHLRFRRLDMSFCGGGTKDGEYIRLGNGIETNGNISDLVVEGCRFHQIYDTAFDPQNTGTTPVTQQGLVYRNNLVSHAGLASFEIWLRPADSLLSDITVENNTFIHAGGGWGYEQHDFPGTIKIGGDIVIFENGADGENVTIRRNVFHNPRVVIMSEFKDDQLKTKELVRGITFADNLWDPGEETAYGAVLYKDSGATLIESIKYASLDEWKASTDVPGKDLDSTEGEAGFTGASDAAVQDSAWIAAAPADQRPTRFGPFALYGNYTRPGAAADNRGRVVW
jgi:hypothetical protein